MACNPEIEVDTWQCSVDCASQPCKVESYGDIGGIGVILGFAITAWFVVVLLIVYYISVYDYSLDIFRAKDDFETVSANPNPVDRVFLSTVRKFRFLDFSQTTGETRRNINKEFNKCVLAFADLQIFTGVGIIASGIRPAVCGLQAYHWELIVHLAWFSSITHLSALSLLHHYLVNRPWQLWARGLLMAVLAGLLAGAVALAGHFDWDDPDRSPGPDGLNAPKVAPSHFARCVFTKKMNRDTLAFESMIFDILLIAYGYIIRLVKTWKRASSWPTSVSNTLSDVSSSRLRNWRPRNEHRTARYYLWTGLLQPLAISLPRVLYLHLNLFTSYLAEVFWLIFSTVWRTVRLTRLVRQYRPASENSWEFGQVLPLIMTAAPFLLLSSPIASLYRAHQRRREQSEPSHPLESLCAAAPIQGTQNGNAEVTIYPGSQTSESREQDGSEVNASLSSTYTPIPSREERNTTDITDASLHVQDDHGETPIRSHSWADRNSSASSISGSRSREPSVAREGSPHHSSDDSARDNEQRDNENALFLESSHAFQGALFLTAWPYVELAIYFLVGNKKGIILPMAKLPVAFLIVNPLLQMFWLSYTTWTSRVPVDAPNLYFNVFITLLAASIITHL